MTLSAQERTDLARWRLEKARGLLADAETLLSARSWASSSNRSYYAILSAARAIFALRGQDPESHEGVKVLLARDYIKTGELSHEIAESLRVLQGRRMDSDYADYAEITESEARDSLSRAKEFVNVLGALVEKKIQG